MSRRPLLAVSLLLPCLAPAPAHALPYHGGSGGTAFDLDCGGDAVLAGVHVNSGTLIDKVEPVCIQVGLTGTWGAKFAVGSAGGVGGSKTSLLCDDGWAVMGIKGASGNLVDSLALHCGKMGRVTEVIKIVEGKVLKGPVGGPGGAAFDDMCPSSQIGRGLKGRSSNLVD